MLDNLRTTLERKVAIKERKLKINNAFNQKAPNLLILDSVAITQPLRKVGIHASQTPRNNLINKCIQNFRISYKLKQSINCNKFFINILNLIKKAK